MLISYKIQTLNFTEDINGLLCELDKRISTTSKTKLDSLRYGVQNCHKSLDYSILVKYRQILISKVSGESCLKNYLYDDIVSNIKQYLTVGKIQKFKKSTTIESQTPKTVGSEPGYNVLVKYNYGDYIVNNFENNNYVTQVNEAIPNTWDQSSW